MLNRLFSCSRHSVNARFAGVTLKGATPLDVNGTEDGRRKSPVRLSRSPCPKDAVAGAGGYSVSADVLPMWLVSWRSAGSRGQR